MKAHRPFGSQRKQECLCHWCPLLLRGVDLCAWRKWKEQMPTTRNASSWLPGRIVRSAEIQRRRPEASGTKGDVKSKPLTRRYEG